MPDGPTRVLVRALWVGPLYMVMLIGVGVGPVYMVTLIGEGAEASASQLSLYGIFGAVSLVLQLLCAYLVRVVASGRTTSGPSLGWCALASVAISLAIVSCILVNLFALNLSGLL